MDKRWSQTIYQTEGYNKTGLDGEAYIEDGLVVKTSSPLNRNPGTNPEQLLSLSLSTCLEATLETIAKEQKLPHTAEVKVTVGLLGGTGNFEFLVHAEVRLPGVEETRAKVLVKEAEHRCCVSKLLLNSGNYTIEYVE
ncbi:MAG: OsmC family protein [Enterococcus sp.]